MSRYDDYRSSTGTLDSRDRYDRYRGPPVAERPRHAEDERFEFRMHEEDRYGPPARAPGRRYDDEHLVHTSGPLVAHDRRRRDESPSFVRPRLLRRQSSLDTFDRIPRRKMEEVRDRAPRMRGIPSAPPPPRASPGRYREREIYEDIRIADPDTYGDEEYRGMHDREGMGHHRRSSSMRRRHHEEKPYPRKGKTRIPRKRVHIHAILDLGYPFKEEDDTIVIQKALSKEQIDEVISLSREFRRPPQVETEYLRIAHSPHREVPRERVTTEHLVVDSHSHYSPRSSHDAFIVEASPSRSPEYEYEELIDRPRRHTISRPRSVSVHAHRPASPVRFVEPREYVEERVGTRGHSGSMVLVRPRNSDHDDYIQDLEEETRLLRLERQGGIEITRQRETDIIDDHGNAEEVTEVRRSERREPNSRVMRAMMATLT
ncbi:hypothetical protein N7448_001823 [Penicillium atrosanguineum]|uniref:DUF8035 domain-containing protein n=1 Tax=Penicillium atrosanguineum TaxID=1132637 RepID=A0A9W9U9R4_9EURO|nr:uncharacterized protein N7443_005221 [Penicillium atrosanguineum]KAJ5150245.1 hypothetical protein N7448_001823 [Penicillium atrosanguineum]KAJ5305561.1 hypothetical protein N7443_005221 [Penicillium atrosanguineum]KAJ5325023.1 hypothetical protein N7476_003623 [Penicillium atrosanguineum]